jgi:hypothetical protein
VSQRRSFHNPINCFGRKEELVQDSEGNLLD